MHQHDAPVHQHDAPARCTSAPARCTSTMHQHDAPARCTIICAGTMHRPGTMINAPSHAPAPCTITFIRHGAAVRQTLWTLGLYDVIAIVEAPDEMTMTHRTEEREVLYPWHPWFGQVVFVHGRVNRGGARVLRCAQLNEEGVRCLETPEWMFDRAACCGVVRGDSPRVNRAALYRLMALISGGFGGHSGAVVEVRSYSLSQEGEADAPSGSRSCPAARSVPSGRSESGVAATPSGHARKEKAA